MLKKIIIYTLILLSLFFIYKFFFQKKNSAEVANQPIHINKHSAAFNESISTLVKQYIAIKDAFVESDTALVKMHTASFIELLNHIDTSEIKNDTASVFETVMYTFSDIQSNAQSIIQQHSIEEMRKDFSSMTDVMFPSLFYALNYEGPKLYLQNCPMAFSDSIPANWLSDRAEIINPYLGKNHPTYQSSMLHCGEIKDSVITK